MAPVILNANQPNMPYQGGAAISAFRSDPPCSSHQPEDWVASTTCLFQSRIGLSKLPDGTLLADAVSDNPEKWLGPEHIAKYGVDTKLLVKLLDAGQRLPVHVHPHRTWAAQHLSLMHGKAEAWYVLKPGSVWLGLKEPLGKAELLELVESERGDELLSRLHKFDVVAHQGIYVPPGTLHCIGKGAMVVEIQEPSDMSILCEWKELDVDGKKNGHLGVGFPTALTAVDNRVYTREEAKRLVTSGTASTSVFAEASTEYFVLERLLVAGVNTCRRGFAILIVVEGKVSLSIKASDVPTLSLEKGATVVLPFEDGDIELQGGADVLIARPPR